MTRPRHADDPAAPGPRRRDRRAPAGLPEPGARPDRHGTTFTVFSAHAEGVELCLFDRPGGAAGERRIDLAPLGDGLWSRHVAGVGPGQLYGLRARGPFRPQRGLRFNPAKLLVDPWARAVQGRIEGWSDALVDSRTERGRTVPDGRDSAPCVPRSVVVDGSFDWRGDRPPRHPWSRTVIYECHVRGMTVRHPEVAPELRGTYRGLASPPVIAHLRSLGITAVELLPVQHGVPERHLLERGAVNYWGYSPLAFFAPHGRYATADDGRQVDEFKAMVRELHAAGIEVLLDVVFNHTAEGGTLGPSLSLRGLDNATFYRLRDDDPGSYEDLTGCGNTLDLAEPRVLAMVIDCLAYWVGEMHVDGFRFDLAPVLGRNGDGFDPDGAFFRRLAADPRLEGVKLIAEPWDLGPDGYRLGDFPAPWREWNDRFRDTARAFWRADGGTVAELASRLAGSRDIFPPARRGRGASIDYVVSHDGFTLADLVSYETRHNHANGEDNHDGHRHNLSRNWGEEGPSHDPSVRRRRRRVQRGLLATVALSGGVPMLAHGDELGRTQHGNNNPYCLDDETTWMDWEPDSDGRELLEFTRRLMELRRRHAPFADLDSGPAQGRWLGTDGRELTGERWHDPDLRTLAWQIRDLLLVLHGGEDPITFHLPALSGGGRWHQLLDTAGTSPRPLPPGPVEVPGSTLLLLRHRTTGDRPGPGFRRPRRA